MKSRKSSVPAAQAVMELLKRNPEKAFYVNELIRLTGMYPNSVQHAVKKLEQEGVVRSRMMGNRRYYRLVDEPGMDVIDGGGPAGVEWVKLVNRISSMSINAAVAESNVTLLPELYGIAVPTFWYNGFTGGVYYKKQELLALGKSIGKELASDMGFARMDIDRCRRRMAELDELGKELAVVDVASLSEKELLDRLARFYEVYLAVFPYMTTPHAIERYFERVIREAVADEQTYAELVRPVFLRDDMVERGLTVAAMIKGKVKSTAAKKAIGEYRRDFGWLSMFSVGDPPLTDDYFEHEVEGLLMAFPNPEKELERLRQSEQRAKTKLTKRLTKIGANPIVKEAVWFLQEYIQLRTERKNALCQAHYVLRPLLEVLADRLGWTVDEVMLCSYRELLGLRDRSGRKKAELQAQIETRKEGWALLMQEGKIQVITGSRGVMDAIERWRIVEQQTGEGNVLKGRTASLGQASGKVVVVRKLADLDKVKRGNVLVTSMTTPDFVPAMRRAAAIVTDEGGVTCHAAIVSRELGVPCVIATKRATKVLRDGLRVMVDADRGEIYVNQPMGSGDQSEWIGTPVFPGVVEGRARIVDSASDFIRVEDGDVVVCAQANPEYISVLYRAGGLVIDEESLTGHGVVYAQALELPCVMGTGEARYGLRNGDRVRLNADDGVVERLEQVEF